jgi:nucleoside-diphosphate-sugar epimerase
MSRILIIGGHGKVALLLAPQLVARGDDAASVIRNPAHAADVSATGATPVVADVETMSVDELTTLAAGYDAVVWSAGAGGRQS